MLGVVFSNRRLVRSGMDLAYLIPFPKRALGISNNLAQTYSPHSVDY